ncbi:hypothetical protein [Basilea psittacipulmonis]|uniref:hypothetical protein n=1 Tax=Basilea psittacipulmonis TaxID=1472345 RepID=UPI00068AB3FC|nr:hypothetical protein [Basilea psittacipulmonis]
MRRKLSYCLALCLVGCATSSHIETAPKERLTILRTAFDPSSLRIDRQHTNALLKGQVAIDDKKAQRLFTAEQIKVVLNPYSNMSQQWYREVCQKGNYLKGEIDSRYQQFIQKTDTQDQGAYVFDQIHPGRYYLVAEFYWSRYEWDSGVTQYGGLLAKKIDLVAGTNQINITDKDACAGFFEDL